MSIEASKNSGSNIGRLGFVALLSCATAVGGGYGLGLVSESESSKRCQALTSRVREDEKSLQSSGQIEVSGDGAFYSSIKIKTPNLETQKWVELLNRRNSACSMAALEDRADNVPRGLSMAALAVGLAGCGISFTKLLFYCLDRRQGKIFS